MKKILLGTSAILGVLTMVASSASAQNLTTMKDQKSSMKASLGGTVGFVIGEGLWAEGAAAGTKIVLPDWRNIISAQADGTTSTLGLTYGAYIRWRPFASNDGANQGATDKAYAYIGQKYFGTVSVGRKESVLSDYFISPTDLVPGYAVDGDINLGAYAANAYEITWRAKPVSVSYKTPSIFGISLGYTYIPSGDTVDGHGGQSYGYNDTPIHDIAGRYDLAVGPVTIGLMGGYRITDETVNDDAFTAGGQVGYTDGKNIGITINGNYVGREATSTWGIGTSFNTPRIAGLSLGMLYASVTDVATDAAEGLFGIGLGYAWSENFAQSFSYNVIFSDAIDAHEAAKTDPGTTSAWALVSQVSF